MLDLLGELKEMTQKKDLELRRYFRKYFSKKIEEKRTINYLKNKVGFLYVRSKVKESSRQAAAGRGRLHCADSGQLWHLQHLRVRKAGTRGG